MGKKLGFDFVDMGKNGLSGTFKERILKLTVGEDSKKLVFDFMNTNPRIPQLIDFWTELLDSKKKSSSELFFNPRCRGLGFFLLGFP